MEHSVLVAENWPLLTEALTYVAHAQIRNRGTVGGSVAHADPAAELPVAFAALDARVNVRSARAERTIEISDLFVTHLTTTLEPDELLVEHRGRLGPRRQRTRLRRVRPPPRRFRSGRRRGAGDGGLLGQVRGCRDLAAGRGAGPSARHRGRAGPGRHEPRGRSDAAAAADRRDLRRVPDRGHPRLRPSTAASSAGSWSAARSSSPLAAPGARQPTPRERDGSLMAEKRHVEIEINGETYSGDGRTPPAPLGLHPPRGGPDRHPRRLRARRLRRVHDPARRRARALVHPLRGPGGRTPDPHGRGHDGLREGELHPLQQAFHESTRPPVRLLHPGIPDEPRARSARGGDELTDREIRERLAGNLCRCTGYQNIVAAVQLARERVSDPVTEDNAD